MEISQILLILVSGLGVLHGFLVAVFLWTSKKANPEANRWLGALLIILSLRVGKSILLAFTDNLDIKIVFTGLALMLLLGPIFFFFTHQLIDRNFQLRPRDTLHFVPTIVGLGMGVWLNDALMASLPKWFFVILFLSYYGHFLIYLLISRRVHTADKLTQDYPLWTWLFYGLLCVWFAYVLNLFDEVIPYILGPILYTTVAYVITYVVVKRNYTTASPKEKYQSSKLSDHDLDAILLKTKTRLLDHKAFADGDLTLRSLSEDLKLSPQTLSLAINKKTGQNFNYFVNSLRIDEAKLMLQDKKYDSYTIAAIAMEVGFNSISSFNTAFKKQLGLTPSQYRKSFKLA